MADEGDFSRECGIYGGGLGNRSRDCARPEHPTGYSDSNAVPSADQQFYVPGRDRAERAPKLQPQGHRHSPGRPAAGGNSIAASDRARPPAVPRPLGHSSAAIPQRRARACGKREDYYVNRAGGFFQSHPAAGRKSARADAATAGRTSVAAGFRSCGNVESGRPAFAMAMDRGGLGPCSSRRFHSVASFAARAGLRGWPI